MISDLLTGLTVGLHLATAHVPHSDYDYLRRETPGVYFRTDGGLTAGLYRNSLSRPSLYLGHTFTIGPVSLTLGGITGYRYRRIWGKCVADSPGDYCAKTYGQRHEIAPLFAPSIKLPTIGGVSPRITLLPGLGRNAQTAAHLSLEAML